MAILNDILGAVLRDVAAARSLADQAARAAGEEYRKDPILRAFPVPRAEIREVSIDLAFAVKGVQRNTQNTAAVAAAVHARNFSAFELSVRDLLTPKDRAVRTRPTPPAKLTAMLSGLRTATGTSLSRFANDEGDATAAEQRLANDFANTALASIEKLGIRATETQVAGIRDRAREFAAAAAVDLRASRGGQHTLDVGVTSQDLQGLPESSIARIKLTVGIENYEWVNKGETDGPDDARLVPR